MVVILRKKTRQPRRGIVSVTKRAQTPRVFRPKTLQQQVTSIPRPSLSSNPITRARDAMRIPDTQEADAAEDMDFNADIYDDEEEEDIEEEEYY